LHPIYNRRYIVVTVFLREAPPSFSFRVGIGGGELEGINS
jgi:hypothetical protein